MELNRRSLLKGLTGAGIAVAGASTEASALGMRQQTEKTPDIDKPFEHIPFEELAKRLSTLAENGDTDKQFIVRLAILPTGEKVYRIIEEPVPPHPLPEKWRKFEMP